MQVILSSAMVQIKQSISRNMFRFCIFINPLLNGILIGMMYQRRSNEDFMLYAVVGNAMTSFWTSICFSSASDIDRERWIGTLPLLFISPGGFLKIIIGKIIGNTMWGGISFLLSMFFVKIIFNFSFIINNPLYFIVMFVMMIITMMSIALLLSGLFTLSRKVRLLMNVIEYPLTMLSGMIFPLSILPRFIQIFGNLLSPTWAMKGFEIAIRGGTTQELYKVTLMLILITMLYLCFARLAFNEIRKASQIHATLEVY